ncbi:hypothetical protein HX92_0619 [Mycobacterium tuberculosis]|nr:hypothetical protein BCGT_3719 [Mycobacterium tuberculosis variant bovis BCG str. ATCC 35743]AKR03797.1 hypothetical protein Mb1595_p4274 [Mycobacterium tuberculosis variant bovis]ALA80528.1 putative membrane protein [Mycobacterium tuberculosis variant bovis BCG]KQL76244.1 hypothetical protein HX92_0619 [Mycobacterium tuberculosis]BAQ08084.1 hypothetical protein KURONO_4316 [Mycobacterium tuberculosis str. Kurono]
MLIDVTSTGLQEQTVICMYLLIMVATVVSTTKCKPERIGC